MAKDGTQRNHAESGDFLNTPHSLEKVANNLFFIVGCGRSGTTLLKTILNAHSKICIPHETFFFNSIANWGESLDVSSKDQKLDRLLSRWWIREMNIPKEELEAYLAHHEPSWQNVLLALLAQQASDQAVCFGEKTVGHVQYAKEFLSCYPQSRVIQIVRDPRAVLASFRSANVGSSYSARIIADWRRSIRVDKSLQEHERYLRVHFEDLIRNPDTVSQKLCDFLAIPYEPTMLEFHQRKESGFNSEQKHHENTTKKIFSSGLEAWKKKLSPGRIGLVEAILGEEMDALGYKVHGTRKILLPRFRLFLSSVGDFINLQLVRRPREFWRRCRAVKRQNASQ